MIRRLIWAGLLLLLLADQAMADTGTYRILDYKVNLTPHSDGIVEIHYYQKWQVTGGHIPWITVGLPNSNFQIPPYKVSGAITKIAPANEGDWSGVRLDLNKDYQPGETFEISFAVLQNKLFYSDEENYKLDFTPGWYDQAFIDSLTITIKFFAKIETIKTNPKPHTVAGEELIWNYADLGKGQKVSVSAAFPKKLFPQEISKDNVQGAMSGGMIVAVIVLVIVVLFVLLCLALLLSSTSGGDNDKYTGGNIFYGGVSGTSSSTTTGGGGGLGGRADSCACACVACACACACAGGGGAGCSKKTSHSCPACNATERGDTTPCLPIN